MEKLFSGLGNYLSESYQPYSLSSPRVPPNAGIDSNLTCYKAILRVGISLTHSIHVWYIYLHLPQESTKCRYDIPYMYCTGYMSRIQGTCTN